MSANILGGDVKTIFNCSKSTGAFEEQLERARQEQEAMCGYPLVTKHTSRMAVQDHEEVIATFGPPETNGENTHG